MSRRRSKTPHRAISITLPDGLLSVLDNRLSETQSRSAYIARAVREKLAGGGFTVAEATDNQLLAALVERKVISIETYNALKNRSSPKE